MSLTRANLLARLQNLSPEAAALCNPAIENTDNAANWGPAIDSTLLLIGVAYADIGLPTTTTPAGKELQALAILRMYGLELLAEKLGGSVSNDIGEAKVKEKRSNVLAQIRRQWVDAVKRVEGMGFQVERQGSSYGDWSLDIYEPDEDV